MIQRSFIFLEGISTVSERNIWQQGISYWQSFLSSKSIKGISLKCQPSAVTVTAKFALTFPFEYVLFCISIKEKTDGAIHSILLLLFYERAPVGMPYDRHREPWVLKGPMAFSFPSHRGNSMAFLLVTCWGAGQRTAV